MKIVDARNFQHHLGSYLDQVADGETLEIRRRKKVVAMLVPYVAGKTAEPWPDLADRLASVYPAEVVVTAASNVLYQDRGD